MYVSELNTTINAQNNLWDIPIIKKFRKFSPLTKTTVVRKPNEIEYIYIRGISLKM